METHERDENDFIRNRRRSVLAEFCGDRKLRKSKRADYNDGIPLTALYTGETTNNRDGTTRYLLRDVRLADGRHVSDHMWIPRPELGLYPPRAGERCRFVGTPYEYKRYVKQAGCYMPQYGIRSVRKMEVVINS